MDEKVTAILDAYHERMLDEARDRRQRAAAGAGHDSIDKYLLAVGPESGLLINVLAKSLKSPNILELGTSYGYSGIWLAEAARSSGGRLITMELQDYKSAYARDMSVRAGLAEYIDFKIGDAVTMIAELSVKIDFVLVDLWKDLYTPCLEAFYPKLNPGAIIVADNMRPPGGEGQKRYASAVREKPGISSVLLPVGQGLEVSRYLPD